jgi:hypothetical protein
VETKPLKTNKMPQPNSLFLLNNLPLFHPLMDSGRPTILRE